MAKLIQTTGKEQERIDKILRGLWSDPSPRKTVEAMKAMSNLNPNELTELLIGCFETLEAEVEAKLQSESGKSA